MNNRIKKLIYTLPQALFSPQNVQQIMGNMKIFKKLKTYLKAQMYSAAGACFPPKYSTNNAKYEQIKK